MKYVEEDLNEDINRIMNIFGSKLLLPIETFPMIAHLISCTLAILKSFNREFNSPKVETVKK